MSGNKVVCSECHSKYVILYRYLYKNNRKSCVYAGKVSSIMQSALVCGFVSLKSITFGSVNEYVLCLEILRLRRYLLLEVDLL